MTSTLDEFSVYAYLAAENRRPYEEEIIATYIIFK